MKKSQVKQIIEKSGWETYLHYRSLYDLSPSKNY